MTLQAVIDEIKLKLGSASGIGTKLELNNKDLTTLVQSSLRELTTYMDTPKLVTVPFQNAIDISNLKIANVINVMRAEPPAGVMQGVSLDPFYLSSVTAIKPGDGSTDAHGIMQTQIQYAVRAMMQNTVQEDLSYITDLYNKKLYVSYSGIKPNMVTIVFKPAIESVQDLPSDYWTSYLVRLSIAHSRIVIGEIRVKYSVPNSPMQVNGQEILSQGREELTQIMEELRSMRSAAFD